MTGKWWRWLGLLLLVVAVLVATALFVPKENGGYRMKVAQNLLQRLWLETRAEAPLPSTATSVWSLMPHHAAPALAQGV